MSVEMKNKKVKQVANLFPNMDGLPEIVQLVKHYSESNQKKISWPLYKEKKFDGNYCIMIVVDNEAYAFSREGNRFTNVGHIEEDFETLIDGCYIGELYNDSCSHLEEFSGLIGPKRVKPLTEEQEELNCHTLIALFDFVEVEEFLAGYSSVPYKDRRHKLISRVNEWNEVVMYEEVFDEDQLMESANKSFELGEEGVCAKNPEGDWKRGRRDHNSMKVVREIAHDLTCVGVCDDGKGKRAGMAAAFMMQWKNGQEIKVDLGKGWTDEKRIDALNNPPIGKVFRVTAMKESSNGILRKAKVQDLRIDKTKGDF